MADMKRCSTCRDLLPTSEFNRRSSSADGRQARCRRCARKWYEIHRESHMKNVAVRNAATRKTYQARLAVHLAEHPCVDCGEDDIRVLDFDHLHPGEKVAEVALLVQRLVAWRHIEAEIAKCEVRCANCHRRVTSERGGHWRQGLWEAAELGRRESSTARLRAVLGAA